MHAAAGWTAVVPLKRPVAAKQRLTGLGSWRSALVAAFATDVVTTLLGSDRVREVVVVGGDGLAATLLGSPRVHRLADVRGLNAAVGAGMRAARRDCDVAMIVLPADLPCLRRSDLEALVHSAPPDRAGALADADGEGTAALVVPSGIEFVPTFGPRSYARHLGAGALPLEGHLSARRDVDTVQHLAVARRLGPGQHTMRVLAEMDAVADGALSVDAH